MRDTEGKFPERRSGRSPARFHNVAIVPMGAAASEKSGGMPGTGLAWQMMSGERVGSVNWQRRISSASRRCDGGYVRHVRWGVCARMRMGVVHVIASRDGGWGARCALTIDGGSTRAYAAAHLADIARARDRAPLAPCHVTFGAVARSFFFSLSVFS
ncbi:LAQU0S12e01596g1_1 [Lachancea quebecensis]|uniref:LAQU0S12e01596g1_1 n=1 Tax=Lachancea quebecensis TaxID=1654605 RepID=A0A0P1KUE0_9SACH|nr:LAQU0S12e01596g1_1 [Lachancea quebecensis]